MTTLLHPPEKNTFRLPTGEPLRREVRQVFRLQREAILRYLRTGKKDQQPPLPWHLPSWNDFRLGALAISERMTPIISAVWDHAGAQFNARVGLDPDEWSVTNPHTAGKIQGAALDFCQETNDTTSEQLDVALARTRQELAEGLAEGEALPKLTKRVNQIFDKAEKWRARRIAQTETSRAMHAAQDEAARQSGVVTGWKWLASADACDLCLAIVARTPAVKLGTAFAVVGTNPTYSHIYYPPAHPNCNCTVVEVLDSDAQPEFGQTLHQPEGATREEVEALAPAQTELINSIFPPPRKPAKPKPIRLARPIPQKPVKPGTFEAALEQAIPLDRYVPTEKQAEALVEAIREYAEPSTSGAFHGMAEPEKFQAIKLWDMDWHFAGPVTDKSAIFRTMWEYRFTGARKRLPDRLVKATRNLYFTGQSNKNDAAYRQMLTATKFTHAAASGGDGNVVAYRDDALPVRTLAHEAAHNLALQLYGSTAPVRGTDYQRLLLHSREKPVSAYAANNPSEDFAEAVEMFVMEPDKMAGSFPERFAIISKIMSDPNYGG
jgi:hypothetical protein